MKMKDYIDRIRAYFYRTNKPKYKIENGVLYMTSEQVEEPNGITTASEHCYKSKECSVVNVPFGEHKVGYNIELLTPLIANRGTTLILSPTDPTKAAITCTKKGGAYVEYPEITGFKFIVKAKCTAVIQTGRSHKAIVDHCNIESNELADYGLIIGDATEKGAIGSLVNETRIIKAGKAAILMLYTGGKHRVNESQMRFNPVGVSMDRGLLIIEHSEMDANEIQFDISGGVALFAHNSTFEGGVFKVSSLETFSLVECKVSGSKIELEDIGYLDLRKSRMNATPVSEGAARVNIKGNYVQPPEDYNKLIEVYCNSDNTIKGNTTGRGIELEPCN